MGVSPQDSDEVEKVTIKIQQGVPVAVNDEQLSPLGIVKTLNKIGGRNGVGRIDMVENRFVGMKSRGVYESPGMTVLYDALLVLEQLTMDETFVTCGIDSKQKLPKWSTTDTGTVPEWMLCWPLMTWQ